MTVHPVPSGAPVSGHAHSSDEQARWAIILSEVVLAFVALTAILFGIAYGIEGSSGVEDNWVGFIGAVAVLGGLAVSLAAFALGVLARIHDERRPLLWLPLSLFPAMATFLVLGELFWWE
ncbi:MAG: hypothetical protein ACXWXO_02380 [Nocardioides sp.]